MTAAPGYPRLVPTSTNLRPPTPADEIFPDTFRAEAFDLIPLDATGVRRAFEPVVLSVAMRAAYLEVGLVPPLELIVATPSGQHEVRELPDVPLAVIVTPTEGGPHRVTLREVAHNQWYGVATVTIEGDPIR